MVAICVELIENWRELILNGFQFSSRTNIAVAAKFDTPKWRNWLTFSISWKQKKRVLFVSLRILLWEFYWFLDNGHFEQYFYKYVEIVYHYNDYYVFELKFLFPCTCLSFSINDIYALKLRILRTYTYYTICNASICLTHLKILQPIIFQIVWGKPNSYNFSFAMVSH